MTRVMQVIERLLVHDNGQDLIEYGMLAALIAIAAMLSISVLGDTIYNVFWKQIGQAI
jgi:Flp pilus assembly pilin Flp